MLFATKSESFSKVKSKKLRCSIRTPFHARNLKSCPSTDSLSDCYPQNREDIIVAALLRAQQETSSSSLNSYATSSILESSSSSEDSIGLFSSSTLTRGDSKMASTNPESVPSKTSKNRKPKKLSKFKIDSKGQYCPVDDSSRSSYTLDSEDTLKDLNDAAFSEVASVADSEENSEVHQMKIKSRNILILQKLAEEFRMFNEFEEQSDVEKCRPMSALSRPNFLDDKREIVVKSKPEIMKSEKAKQKEVVAQVLQNLNENKYFVMPPKKSTYEEWKKVKDEEIKEKNLQKEKELQALQEKRQKQAELNRIAFSKWYEESKNKPKPPPILSSKYLAPGVTQSGPSLNWNPVPWIDNWAEEEGEDYAADERFKNISKSDTKTNVELNGGRHWNPRMAGRCYSKSDFLVRTMLESRFSTKAFLLADQWRPSSAEQKSSKVRSRAVRSATGTHISKVLPTVTKGIVKSNNIPAKNHCNSMKCNISSVISGSGKNENVSTRKKVNVVLATAVGQNASSKITLKSDIEQVTKNNFKIATSATEESVNVDSRKTRMNVGKR